MTSSFAPLDWLVIGAYVAVLFAGGWLFKPRHTGNTREYYLADQHPGVDGGDLCAFGDAERRHLHRRAGLRVPQ